MNGSARVPRTLAGFAAVALLFGASSAIAAARAQHETQTTRPAESAASTDGPVDPATAMAASTPVPVVTPAEVLKLIQQKDPGVVIVDTQPASGYAAQHIPGAINYPWQMRIHTFPISLPRDKTLIFYGDCPHDTSDTVAQLSEYGYFNVKIMDGGIFEWVKRNYPTVRQEDSAHPDLSQKSAQPVHRGN
jgi:rhodanese-related sulfurtransferase